VIDIHCHILPGIDDGPERLETSLAMASMAAADGIRTIIATPHTDGVRVHHAAVTQAVEELNHELESSRIPVTVAVGFEIPYHLLDSLAATHTLADSRYVLVEFPHGYIPRDAGQTLYNLIMQGLRPIIAHPERNGGVLTRPDRLAEFIDAGALAQLTAASITGDLGSDVQRCALYLLNRNLSHFIATDSHSPSFRQPVLGKARAVAEKILGQKEADLLVMGNPVKITQSTDWSS